MTAQVHEKLIYKGEALGMAYCPPIPRDHPRIIQLDQDAVQKGIREGTISNIIFSTACWRHYIGIWEIKDGMFYLADVRGVLGIDGDEPIWANWFTGVLRIPRGQMLHYVHMGFGSVFEEELHVKIENGIVAEINEVDNRNKEVDHWDLTWRSLPGNENSFDGDDL